FHLGMGAEEWAGRLASYARHHGLPFVYTSSVSVFGDASGLPDGPFRPQDEPTATDDYGRYKARCERAVLGATQGRWSPGSAGRLMRTGWATTWWPSSPPKPRHPARSARAGGGVLRHRG